MPFWWGGGGCTQVPVSTWGGQRGTDKCAITLVGRGTAFPGGKREKQFEVRFSLHDPWLYLMARDTPKMWPVGFQVPTISYFRADVGLVLPWRTEGLQSHQNKPRTTVRKVQGPILPSQPLQDQPRAELSPEVMKRELGVTGHKS